LCHAIPETWGGTVAAGNPQIGAFCCRSAGTGPKEGWSNGRHHAEAEGVVAPELGGGRNDENVFAGGDGLGGMGLSGCHPHRSCGLNVSRNSAQDRLVPRVGA
jgi:hypothetical protein